MRLKSVKIAHFRGYRNATTIPISEGLTGIVGKNDYGKSTILEAMAIFFEADGVKVDKADMNCFSLQDGIEQFEIACEFDDLPGALVLDENAETSLAREYLLNADGALEIVKIYKGSTGKLERTAIRCNHPSDRELAGLLKLKIDDLKKLGEQRGVTAAVADKRVASQWRQAIRDATAPLDLAEALLDVDKGLSTESKSIWAKIEDQLPSFALFKSDRESNDDDAEAKNPLQQAVKEAQAALKEEIGALEARIEASVLDVAGRTLEKLREMAPELAQELVPRFKEKPKWTFNFTLDGENGIPINKRGSGVRRLILLNFFRAEAERAAIGAQKNVIYAIEEPETSQHPNYQVMLMRALLSLASQESRQIIVTTHVPALAGLIPIEGVRYVAKDENKLPVVRLPSPEVLAEAAESLGVLPETGAERARGVVLVEGKCDVIFLQHASTTLRNAGHLERNFEDAGVVALQVGGCGNMKHWVTQGLVDRLGLPWCVFLDSDIGGGDDQVRAIQKRRSEVEAAGRAFFATKKREIENYLCPQLILAETGVEVDITDTCDAKQIIGNAARMNPDSVIDRFWPMMAVDQMVNRSTYEDNGARKVEILELITNIIGSVSPV